MACLHVRHLCICVVCCRWVCFCSFSLGLPRDMASPEADAIGFSMNRIPRKISLMRVTPGVRPVLDLVLVPAAILGFGPREVCSLAWLPELRQPLPHSVSTSCRRLRGEGRPAGLAWSCASLFSHSCGFKSALHCAYTIYPLLSCCLCSVRTGEGTVLTPSALCSSGPGTGFKGQMRNLKLLSATRLQGWESFPGPGPTSP